MGFYDAFKDAISLAQKADNIELYRQLLDLAAQALDLQDENARLRREVSALQEEHDIKNQIIRHKEPYITLANDALFLPYCAICWAKEKKLYQMKKGSKSGIMKLYCYNCHNQCYNEVP